MSNVDFRPILKEINQINSNLQLIGHHVLNVEQNVGVVSEDLQTTRTELLELRAAFEAYVEQAERTAAIQHAETKIGNLKAELDRQFGHYGLVRRTSVGVLQAFDIGNVTNEVVSQVSEELMIQSPRYWLAPALVGLAAWSRDDKDICEKSIAEAYGRDQAKTALFFTLVLRRVKRTDAAMHWLKHYLMACDPLSLTREYAVILEAAAEGAFGPVAEQILAEKLTTWNTALRQRQNIVDAQISEWESEFESNRQSLVSDDYKNLKALSPEFPQFKELVEAPTALGAFAEKFGKIRDIDVVPTGTIEDTLDDLLEQLVTEYDEEELPLRRDVAYNEAIIDSQGDLKQAKVKADQYVRALENTIDAVTLQTRAALNPDLLGVSTNTQRVTIGTCISDIRMGLAQYTKNYRAQYLDQVSIVLDNRHSGYAQELNFGSFATSTSEDEQQSLTRLHQHWKGVFQRQIELAKFKPSDAFLPIFIAFVVFFILMLGGPMTAFIGLLLGVGGAAFWIYNKKNSCDTRVKEIEAQQETAFNVSRDILLEARAEFFDLHLEYGDLDADEAEVIRLLDTWPTTVQKEAM